MRLIYTLLLTVAFTTPAWANPEDTVVVDTHAPINATAIDTSLPGMPTLMTGAVTPITNIDLNTMPLNETVVLEGKIVPSDEDGHYLLQDGTGTIPVRIEDHVLDGMPLNVSDKIRLRGNIENLNAGDRMVRASIVEKVD